MSTASGSSGVRAADATCTWSPDMLGPVLVSVDLAANSSLEDLLDLARHRPGLAVAPDQPVVDRADRDNLRGRAGEERLVRRVQVRPQDVADLGLVAEVAGDRHHRTLGDPLERPRRGRRRDDPAAFDD